MAGKYDGSLVYDTKINTGGFDQGTENIKKKAKAASNDVKKSLEDTRDTLENFNKTAKKIALGAAAIGAGVLSLGISYNSQMEQYNAGFTTMLGNAEKAQKLMDGLKGFAAKTPFELTDLANASTTLLAFGEDVEQLMPDLKMLGDISLGNAEKFKGLALVFGQVQSQGRLMGQDLLQMINQGFNPLQIISEKTGKSVATLKDEMAKGQITFEMVADAMRTATSEGGQFYNAMETQSKNLMGQWSTLKDNVIALTGEISEDISKKLTTSVLPKLIEKVEELSQQWEDGSLQDAIGTATSALAAFGTAIVLLNAGLFISDLIQIKKGVEGFTAATKAGAAAQKLMNSTLMSHPYALALTALAALTVGLATYAATHKTAAEEMLSSHNEAMLAIDKTLEKEEKQVESAENLKGKLYELEEQIKSGQLTDKEAEKAKQKFNSTANELNELIPGITDNLFDETGEINIQRDAVDNLANSYVKLMKAKAVANAYQSKMQQTESDILDAEKKLDNLSPTEKYLDMGWFLATGELSVRDNSEYVAAKDALQSLNDEMKWLEEEAEKALENYDELDQLWSGKTGGNEDVETSNGIVKSAKKTTEEISKEFETQYKNLKRALERDKITHADYYKELKKLRDEYFTEGSDGWEKYTEELGDFTEETFDNCLDALDDFKDESIDKINELKDEQESLKEKLITDKAPIEWGTIDGESFVSLANYDKEINQMQRYGNMLDELFQKKGDLPQSVLDELKDMDTEQAMRYMQALLNSSDSQFDAFIQARQKLEEEASKNSTKLVSAEAEEMKRILEEKFGELPEDFFKLGDESATAFGEAFLTELKTAMQMVRNTIMAEMSAISNTALLSFSSAVGSGASSVVHNNYSSTYTFNSSRDTTTQQLNAARNADTVARLRGGN